MTRTLGVSEFKINHRIKFRSLIRGYHMYKNIWSPYEREKLAACPNDQKVAFEYNKYTIGIYKKKDGDCDELVGYAAAEILSLRYHFLQNSNDNYVKAEILGK